MNKADSERVAAALEELGLRPSSRPEEAEVVVLNSCVVRGHAEDKVVNKILSLQGLKRRRPGTLLGVMGCLVPPDRSQLVARFPHVDVFFTVHEIERLLAEVRQRWDMTWQQALMQPSVMAAPKPAPQPSADAEFSLLQESEAIAGKPQGPTKYIPVIYGCNNFCSYCIVPYRRGRERSRPPEEIMDEIEQWVARGVREVTLLGQNVDAYAYRRDDGTVTDLADLLRMVHAIPGLWRIRFLTSHPRDMSDKLINTVATLSKVCPAINLPVQSGDDAILAAMRRGYTVDEYRRLISRIRAAIPGVAITTDLIVGFPGETEEQFQHSCRLLEELRFDMVHVAAYSPRPGTRAAQLPDDVPPEEKARRLHIIEALQRQIAAEINACLVGKTVEVLVEARHKGKWMGRTPTDKIVFFQDEADLLGSLVMVQITRASPWSLQGVKVAALDMPYHGMV